MATAKKGLVWAVLGAVILSVVGILELLLRIHEIVTHEIGLAWTLVGVLGITCSVLTFQLIRAVRGRARDGEPPDDRSGVRDAVKHACRRGDELFSELERHAQKPGLAPYVFDSEESCVLAYVGGLNAVQTRFWTTTFVTSGFWTNNDARVMDANLNMLSRLRRAGEPARRLVLLAKPPMEEMEELRQRLVHHRRTDEFGRYQEIESSLSRFDASMRKLVDDGCEIRCVHDKSGFHQALVKELAFDPVDSEIAIYDSIRVDVFSGGRIGRVATLRSFCHGLRQHDALLNSATSYFQSLWTPAEPIERYLLRLADARRQARERIDYESNWLLRYEHAETMSPQDAALKTSELDAVRRHLESTGRWGSARSLLDVGTCTGRYLRALGPAVVASGQLVGIDDDSDCIAFARAFTSQDPRVDVRRQDICREDVGPPEQFDIITCMLGTVSHFGAQQSLGQRDVLQTVVDRLARLLAPNGVLFIGNWTQYACEHREMLAIYNEPDRVRIADWTPSVEELRSRLARAGLTPDLPRHVDKRLDLIVCDRGMSAGSGVPTAHEARTPASQEVITSP